MSLGGCSHRDRPMSPEAAGERRWGAHRSRESTSTFDPHQERCKPLNDRPFSRKPARLDTQSTWAPIWTSSREPETSRGTGEKPAAHSLMGHSTAGSYLAPRFRRSRRTLRAHPSCFLVSPIQIFWSARWAFDCQLFGSLLKTLALLCTQQLHAGLRPRVLDRLPEAERGVSELRHRKATPLQVWPQNPAPLSPASARLVFGLQASFQDAFLDSAQMWSSRSRTDALSSSGRAPG
jgi:hypothetical protein